MTQIDLGEFDRRYSAFISYRHLPQDRQWAKWVMDVLERYRTPSPLVKKGFPARIGPMYRDEDENPASAELNQQIEKALAASDALIVIASQDTQKSQWIDREVRQFQAMGKGDRILVLLIDGEPKSSYPLALLEEDREPIAADVRPRPDEPQKLLKQRAKLRLAAALLRCAYDDLAQRERQRQRRRAAIAGALAISALAAAATLLVSNAQENERMRLERLAVAISDSSSNLYEDDDRAFAMFSGLSRSSWPYAKLPPRAARILGKAARTGSVTTIDLPEAARGATAVAATEDDGFAVGTGNGTIYLGNARGIEPLRVPPPCPTPSEMLRPCAISAIAVADGRVAAGTGQGHILMFGRNAERIFAIEPGSARIDVVQPLRDGGLFVADEIGVLFHLGRSGEILKRYPGRGAVASVVEDKDGRILIARISGAIEIAQRDGSLGRLADYGPAIRSFFIDGDKSYILRTGVLEAFSDGFQVAEILTGPPARARPVKWTENSAMLESSDQFSLAPLGSRGLLVYGSGSDLSIGTADKRDLVSLDLIQRFDPNFIGSGFSFKFPNSLAGSRDGRWIFSIDSQSLSLAVVDLNLLRELDALVQNSRTFRSDICDAKLVGLFKARSGEVPACT